MLKHLVEWIIICGLTCKAKSLTKIHNPLRATNSFKTYFHFFSIEGNFDRQVLTGRRRRRRRRTIENKTNWKIWLVSTAIATTRKRSWRVSKRNEMKKRLPALLQFFNYVFQQRCTQSEIDVFEDGGWVKQYAPSLFKTIDIDTIIEQCKKTQTFITHPLVFFKSPTYR